MDFKKLNDQLKQYINETMERYLSVEPTGPNVRTPGFNISLYQGETKVPNKLNGNDFIGMSLLHSKPLIEYTDQEIRDIAKQYFDNITDDIRVIWY